MILPSEDLTERRMMKKGQEPTMTVQILVIAKEAQELQVDPSLSPGQVA